jgi:predicted amidohydrolase YtcJ
VSLFLQDAEVDGRVVGVRVVGGRIHEVGPDVRARSDDDVVEAGGGALLPGLHDHHLHLMALAVAAQSVRCGPPEVTDRDGLRRALQSWPGRSWVRGIGYHESVAGLLDRDVLDALVPDRPVRVQHRGGALWVVNSAALALLALDHETSADVERDDQGRLTGRLWRWDDRLRGALGGEPPDLAPVGSRLAALGITGVTDATPDLDVDTCALLHKGIPQQVQLLGAPDGPGPRKLLLHDHDLPNFAQLLSSVRSARDEGRPVAVHCVTRESLLLTLAVLAEVGTVAGDRIEHAAVVPDGIAMELSRLQVRVVTQPVFLADRGDDYLRDVAPDDRGCLYPYRSLLEAGVPVAPSSDAPFGDLDPWRGIAAARDRRTTSGQVVNVDERVAARSALDGYLSPLDDPGGLPRQVRAGVPADLCLLDVPLDGALAQPSADHVRLVLRAGVTLPP